MRPFRIGIIGGGPGGLITAYSLQKMASVPLNITVFEAGSRLGGKILTPEFSVAPVRYEAGAAEFYDYSIHDLDPLKELIAELGLPISPMGGPSVVVENRILANLDDIEQQFGSQSRRSLLEFDRMARSRMTPQEFYHSDDPEALLSGDQTPFDQMLAHVDSTDVRHFVETLIHSDLATEPNRTSCGYGLQNYLMNDAAYMNLYGIIGGNERLPQELAARLAANVKLMQPVKSVCKDGDALRITSLKNGMSLQDHFDFVVIALPHSHLKTISYSRDHDSEKDNSNDRLATAMNGHYDHFNYPAHYLRITILFERPFWRGRCADSYWMLDRWDGCCLYDESARDPGSEFGVLGWLLGGKSAEQMSELKDEELIKEALKSLPDFCSDGKETFLEGRVHRWIGAVNAIPGGRVRKSVDHRHQPEPIEHPNLFVVGDYLYDSTINGVIDGAQYVAAWIAARVAEPSIAQSSTAGAAS